MIRIRKNSIAFTSLLAMGGALTTTTAFAAPGDCLEWDVSGFWNIAQSNGTNVSMKIQQVGTIVQGVAEYSSYNGGAHKVETVGGPVYGTYDSGYLRVTAYWSNSSAGLYTGHLEPNGGMVGFAVDKNDPGNKATFTANGAPICHSREAPPPPPLPPVALGRVKEPPKALGRAAPRGSVDPNKTMCDYARSAKARNSPTAPALEHRCLAGGGSMAPPPPPVAVPVAVPVPVPVPAPAPAPAPVAAPDMDALAAVGAAISQQDPEVAEARSAEVGAFFQLGFDIASGLFGDPALGSAGRTVMDPDSEALRSSLSGAGQRGFNASAALHLARDYKR